MKLIFILTLLFSSIVNAQSVNPQAIGGGEPPATQMRSIVFNYDNAGNQIKRELVININRFSAPEDRNLLLEIDNGDLISYFPNPVKDNLYLKWSLTDNKKISFVSLHSFSGQVINTYRNLSDKQEIMINFYGLSQGTYALVLQYSNGTQKSIKIIKQ